MTAITVLLLLIVGSAFAQDERQMFVRWQIDEENTIGLSYEDSTIQMGDSLGFEINNKLDWVIVSNNNEYAGTWFVGLSDEQARNLKKYGLTKIYCNSFTVEFDKEYRKHMQKSFVRFTKAHGYKL